MQVQREKILFSSFYIGKMEAKRLAHSHSSPGERTEGRLLTAKPTVVLSPSGVLKCGDLVAVILEEKQ